MGNKEFIRKTFTASNKQECVVTYCRITGAASGPTLTIIAGQHGMEHSGPNILRQLINDIDPESFNGVLQICPCCNPLALALDYEFYPENEPLEKLNDYYYSRFRHDYCIYDLGRKDTQTWYNMNRLWNRQEIHGIAGSITQWLWDEIIVNSKLVIDMHCLQSEKPLIFNWGEQNLNWAKYFGIEGVIMCSENLDDYNQHNISNQVNKLPDANVFCVEFSRQHGLKESEYPLGVKGIENMMKAMGMIDGDIIHQRPVYCIRNINAIHSNAKHAGHVRFYCELYDSVKTGDKVYEIWNPQTLETLEEFIAPFDGVISKMCYQAVVKFDDLVCSLAEPDIIAEAGIPLNKIGF